MNDEKITRITLAGIPCFLILAILYKIFDWPFYVWLALAITGVFAARYGADRLKFKVFGIKEVDRDWLDRLAISASPQERQRVLQAALTKLETSVKSASNPDSLECRAKLEMVKEELKKA